MLAQFVTICLVTLTVGSPIPINSTIANIENYFGNLAESLISRGEVNTTEKFHSADGHTQVAIEPAQTATLQEILFHPTNHRLIAENKTKLFSNATEEVDLIKVDLVTESTATEHHEPDETTKATITTKVPEYTKLHILTAIPTTIVDSTTVSSTFPDSSTEVISGTTNIDSTKVGKNETTLVEIVTPENDVSGGYVTSTTIATSSTTEPESESSEIRDKIKEVQADPVILTVGV
ncbi:uncharacterized protein LOC135698079 [Ochlerotatus camptorhynchus]|uniref:uncharacterized protein LOC135698079 n=1 Tax=Ochlerotatus camptorhynchus TaxID=644619 RepID=UPI0031D2BF96